MSTQLSQQIIRLGLAWLCVGLGLWSAGGLYDEAIYAFAPRSAPQPLGDVLELLPEQIPHNNFVALHGITEHRGLRHRDSRGLRLRRQDRWLLRLLGSRGTFIEVPPDAQRFAPTTEVRVEGRAVDPARTPKYAALLQVYDKTFVTARRLPARIIEVGVAPGEGRLAYIVMLLGVAGLIAIASSKTIAFILRVRRGVLS